MLRHKEQHVSLQSNLWITDFSHKILQTFEIKLDVCAFGSPAKSAKVISAIDATK